jgi:hypothetical protein
MSKIKIVDFFSSSLSHPHTPSDITCNRKECYICYEDVNENHFKKLSCTHELCQSCYSKLPNEKCPFCRQIIKEKIIELIEDPEEWLLYDINEWITYSRVLRDGREAVYTYHCSDQQPAWRNDDNVMILRRNRQRKRRQRYYTE